MPSSLADKTAIVTGAAAGIGRATTRRLLAEGAYVLATDIDEQGLARLAESFAGESGSLDTAILDVTDRAQTIGSVERAIAARNGLDILVNCAGITPRNVPQRADLEEKWHAVLDVNLKGTMLMCHAATQAMLDDGGGAIVNLASIMGVIAYHDTLELSDGFSPYPQSKGAVIQLTRDMATSLAKHDIRVNAVCPGFVNTKLIAGAIADERRRTALENRPPMGRFGEPEEIANVVCFLASSEASFVTGAAWLVDGGYTAC